MLVRIGRGRVAKFLSRGMLVRIGRGGVAKISPWGRLVGKRREEISLTGG